MPRTDDNASGQSTRHPTGDDRDFLAFTTRFWSPSKRDDKHDMGVTRKPFCGNGGPGPELRRRCVEGRKWNNMGAEGWKVSFFRAVQVPRRGLGRGGCYAEGATRSGETPEGLSAEKHTKFMSRSWAARGGGERREAQRERSAVESETIARRYLRYREAGIYTGLHRTSLWRAVRAGKLEPSGDGRGRRFDIKELDKFMSSRRRER